MNSESGKKLSLDELKKLNPAEQQTEQEAPQDREPPTPLWTLTAEDLEEILNNQMALWSKLESIHNKIQSNLQTMNQNVETKATKTQLEELIKQVEKIQRTLEQAGKKKEKKFFLPKLTLPEVPPEFLVLMMGFLVTFFTIWYNLGKILSL